MVYIFPSWYASKEAPTSGSFFREQSILMENDYDIHVIVGEKKWISKQRFLYNKFSRTKTISTVPLEIVPPQGVKIQYPFCKFMSEEENYKAQLRCYINYIENKQKETGHYPNLLHAHTTFTGGILAVDLGEYFNIQTIITEHNPFLLHNYSDFWKSKIIYALENANRVLAVSEHQRQNILMHGIRCNPITVGNLVDDERFFIKNKTEKDTKIKLLIVTYYPNFIKDMETFFKAMVILKNNKTADKIDVTIVGGGELSGEYKSNYYVEKIHALGLESFIKVNPTASRDEMVVLMQETDALISSSVAESFGVAICEAMLCGKPIVTTASGGINDTVDNQCGIVVKIHDPIALAEGIEKLITTIHTYNPNVIREKIVKKFGQNAFRLKITNIYNKCLNDFNTNS